MVTSTSKGRAWIVCGASPGAPKHLPIALAACPDSVRMTSNAGVKLFLGEWLDYYFCHDRFAMANYEKERQAARYRGTQIITLDQGDATLTELAADILITPGERRDTPQYEYRKYLPIRFSGNWCIQFALDHRPTELHLCGMAGYRSTTGDDICVDYFDGSKGRKLGYDYSVSYTKPFLQSCFKQCPDTRFVLYGNHVYGKLSAPNLELVPCR